MGIAVEDSFNAALEGSATGKVAGALNNASSGVITATDSNQISQYINLLEFIKMEMSDVAGISRQREGQISNRETVGGVERATLQSSHITEWLFTVHEDLKKRVLECFLETAKIALKGRSKKFQYILPDSSTRIIEIDGDEFAESDYGLIVDNSENTQELNQKIDALAQAALQNQTLHFSTIMKLYSSCSIAEKQRLIEKDEAEIQENQSQSQQAQLEMQQQELERRTQLEQSKLEQEDALNQRDNDTKIQIAYINAMNNNDYSDEETFSEEARANLLEKMRQFDERIKLDREKFEFDKDKARTDAKLQEKKITMSKVNNKSKQ